MTLVLNDPDVFLLELGFQALLLLFPEPPICATVNHVVDSVLLRIEYTRSAQPRPLRVAFPRPAHKAAHRFLNESRRVVFRVVGPAGEKKELG